MKIHTHELRKNTYELNPVFFKTEVLFEGNINDCYAHLLKLCEHSGYGVGFYLSNLGYHVIDLAEERKNKIKDAAPEMLELLLFWQKSGKEAENFAEWMKILSKKEWDKKVDALIKKVLE